MTRGTRALATRSTGCSPPGVRARALDTVACVDFFLPGTGRGTTGGGGGHVPES